MRRPARITRHPIRSIRLRPTGALALVCLCAAAALNASPPSGGAYSLPKQAIASGGSAASGGDYQLVGTIGQSVTGPTTSGSTQLQQGFHAGQPGADELFNDSFE